MKRIIFVFIIFLPFEIAIAGSLQQLGRLNQKEHVYDVQIMAGKLFSVGETAISVYDLSAGGDLPRLISSFKYDENDIPVRIRTDGDLLAAYYHRSTSKNGLKVYSLRDFNSMVLEETIYGECPIPGGFQYPYRMHGFEFLDGWILYIQGNNVNAKYLRSNQDCSFVNPYVIESLFCDNANPIYSYSVNLYDRYLQASDWLKQLEPKCEDNPSLIHGWEFAYGGLVAEYKSYFIQEEVYPYDEGADTILPFYGIFALDASDLPNLTQLGAVDYSEFLLWDYGIQLHNRGDRLNDMQDIYIKYGHVYLSSYYTRSIIDFSLSDALRPNVIDFHPPDIQATFLPTAPFGLKAANGKLYAASGKSIFIFQEMSPEPTLPRGEVHGVPQTWDQPFSANCTASDAGGIRNVYMVLGNQYLILGKKCVEDEDHSRPVGLGQQFIFDMDPADYPKGTYEAKVIADNNEGDFSVLLDQQIIIP